MGVAPGVVRTINARCTSHAAPRLPREILRAHPVALPLECLDTQWVRHAPCGTANQHSHATGAGRSSTWGLGGPMAPPSEAPPPQTKAPPKIQAGPIPQVRTSSGPHLCSGQQTLAVGTHGLQLLTDQWLCRLSPFPRHPLPPVFGGSAGGIGPRSWMRGRGTRCSPV